MFWKKKKPKLKFYCQLPEVQETYPIVPSKEVRFSWQKEVVKNYKAQNAVEGTKRAITSSVKCPGIVPSMRMGYIVKSWFDLTIITEKDDPKKFQYFFNDKMYRYLEERNFHKARLISWFSSEDKAHTVPLAENDLQELIKISTPWWVDVPKGYKLLVTPITYGDRTEFSSVHGVLDHSAQWPINVILKWHKRPGETFIPAGTPLCQLILVKDDEVPYEISPWTEKNLDADLYNDFMNHHSFTPKPKK